MNRTKQIGHERKDVDVSALIIIAALLLLTGAFVLLSAWALLHFFTLEQNARTTQPPKVAEERHDFPQPRLQVNPSNELQVLRSVENVDLNSYGWVDRTAGVARIPIERAMQLILERGLPDVGAGLTPLQLMQARPKTNPQPNERQPPQPTPEPTQ